MKTHLVVKDTCNLMECATGIFDNIGISITSSGRRVLGSPIGSQEFVHIILCWRKWGNGFPRCTLILTSLSTPSISLILLPLYMVFQVNGPICPILVLILATCYCRLPPHHGGLGSLSESRYKASTAITLPLVNAILGESSQSAYEAHCAQLNFISGYKNRPLEIKHTIQTLQEVAT